LRKERLPKQLEEFFWDHNFDSLSWVKDQELIVSRILSAGDFGAISWLRSRLGDDGLRTWIRRRQGRGLDSRKLRFWELILRLPHDEVTRWMEDPGRKIWDERLAR
jgi:hypothetical protein